MLCTWLYHGLRVCFMLFTYCIKPLINEKSYFPHTSGSHSQADRRQLTLLFLKPIQPSIIRNVGKIQQCKTTVISLVRLHADSLTKDAQKAAKLLNKDLFFKSALLILTVPTNAFHSTNSFCCFSRCQAPTNSVAPHFCI